MAGRGDTRVRVTSEFDDRGFKSAEASAKVLERELNRLEAEQRRMASLHIQASKEMAAADAARQAEQRRMASLQMQASREMAAAEEEKARAVIAANQAQQDAMVGLGRGITVASLAAATGLALSAKAAMDWESAWAGVTKTVDGSDEQMADLEEELRGLARTLPATHDEIAGVAEAAGQLGVKAGDIAGFTKTMIDLGETTNLTSDEAATALAQLSNIMGVSAAEAGRMGATLVALGNAGASTEQDIVSMGLRIAGAGRTAGMTSDKVLAFASSLSSVGIEAEAGGTAISRVMLSIDSSVKSGSDAVEGFAEVAGVSTAEFARAWREDAAGALTTFIQGLGRMQDAGKDTTATLDELGFADVRVADALRRSALAGDLLADSLELGSDAWAENMALVEEANKRYETAESRMEIARNRINDTAIDIGANLLPAVGSGVEIVGDLAAGFGALPDGVQQAITVLGVVATAVGVVGGAALMATPKILAAKAAIDSLNGGSSKMGTALGGAARILTGPWGLAIAGAGAALGVLTAMFGANQRAQDESRAQTQALADTFDEATGAMTDYSRQWFFNEASTRGYIDAAKSLGLDLGVVMDAIMGNADAAATLNAGMEELRVGALGLSADVRDETLNNINLLSAAFEWGAETSGEAKTAWENQAEAGVSAAGAASGLADATTDATGATQDQVDAIKTLIEVMDVLNGANQSREQAEINWQEQLVKTGEVLGENGKTLDVTTEAGRNNRQAMLDMAQSAMALAQARLEQTGSEDQFRQTLDQARDALFNQARQFFDTDEAAWAYVDQLLKVPEDVTTQVETPGLPEAKQGIAELIGAINRVPAHKVITFEGRSLGIAPIIGYVPGTGQPIYGAANADGGLVKPYAGGGMEDHTAQIAAGGWPVRVWAEPETDWEAYIPGAMSKRPRSTAILEDVATRFGLRLSGPGTSTPEPGGRGIAITVSVGDVHGGNEAVGDAVVTRLRDHMAARGIALIGAGV